MIKPILKKVAFFAVLAGLIMFLEKDTIASGNVKLFSDSYPKSERREIMDRLRKTRIEEVQASLKDKKK